MFLSKITVQNFRLLKDFSVDLEQELSLIIGKTIQVRHRSCIFWIKYSIGEIKAVASI